jgi:hypothetical protein
MMPRFQAGDRVRTNRAFQDFHDRPAGGVGVVETVYEPDLLLRVPPESSLYSEAWEGHRNGTHGKFWYIDPEFIEFDGPPSTIQAMSRLIVAELTK